MRKVRRIWRYFKAQVTSIAFGYTVSNLGRPETAIIHLVAVAWGMGVFSDGKGVKPGVQAVCGKCPRHGGKQAPVHSLLFHRFFLSASRWLYRSAYPSNLTGRPPRPRQLAWTPCSSHSTPPSLRLLAARCRTSVSMTPVTSPGARPVHTWPR